MGRAAEARGVLEGYSRGTRGVPLHEIVEGLLQASEDEPAGVPVASPGVARQCLLSRDAFYGKTRLATRRLATLAVASESRHDVAHCAYTRMRTVKHDAAESAASLWSQTALGWVRSR